MELSRTEQQLSPMTVFVSSQDIPEHNQAFDIFRRFADTMYRETMLYYARRQIRPDQQQVTDKALEHGIGQLAYHLRPKLSGGKYRFPYSPDQVSETVTYLWQQAPDNLASWITRVGKLEAGDRGVAYFLSHCRRSAPDEYKTVFGK